MDLSVDCVWEWEGERYHGVEDSHVYEVTEVGPGAEENYKVGDHDWCFDVVEDFGGL